MIVVIGLAVAAGILAAVDLFNEQGRSLTAWAALLLSIAVVYMAIH